MGAAAQTLLEITWKEPGKSIKSRYIYRACNARVYGIRSDEHVIGAALVRNMDEEPACYELQQFMIDRRFQNMGYGTEALRLILSMLSKEREYSGVEVCVLLQPLYEKCLDGRCRYALL